MSMNAHLKRQIKKNTIQLEKRKKTIWLDSARPFCLFLNYTFEFKKKIARTQTHAHTQTNDKMHETNGIYLSSVYIFLTLILDITNVRI